MRMRRLFSTVLLASLFIIVNMVTAQGTTVTLWQNDSEFGECVANYLSENYSNPDIQLDVTLYPQMIDASRTALQGGAGPDIVQTHGPSYTAELADAGLVAPLDEYAEQYGWSDRFAPWALNLGTYNGSLYSVPDELETVVLWYNKTLFEEKGWQLPTTMDELFTLAETVQDEGIIPFAPAFGECQPCLEWLVGVFLNHYAGPDLVYEALTGQRSWTDPAFVEAITRLNEMMQNNWLMGGKDFFFSDTFDSSHSQFGTGEIAMNLEGTWFQSGVNDFFGEEAGNNNDWEWVAIPTTFSTDPFYMIGVGASWSLNAASPNKAAAAEVMNWLFSPEAQVGLFEACGKSPAPISIEGDVFANSDPRIARVYSSFAAASEAGNVGYTPWSFWPPKTDVYLYEGIAQVYDGQITVEDYLTELDRLFQEELAEGAVPPIPARS
jgi:raffinose/stachyose/melibiose transport system substrate-binding protein